MSDTRIKDRVLCNPSVKLEKGVSYSFIDMEAITPGIKAVGPVESSEYSGQSCSKFCNGDTLMARITPCLENGKITQYMGKTAKAFGSTEFFVFRGIPKITDNDYVYYLMSTPYIRKSAVNSMTGASGRQRADITFISKIKWDFPSYQEQKRIAEILSVYDNLIEVNNKRIKVLEQMAENLYKEWFVRFRFPGHESTKFENGIPQTWEIKRIRDIVKRLPFGTLYKAEDTEREGNVVVIDQSQAECVGYHSNEPSHIASTDYPIALFGDHSCKYQLMITPFSLSENVIPYVGKEGVLTTYLYYLTHGTVETTEYKRHWSEFTAKKVLVAPIYLQKQFIEFVNPSILMKHKLSMMNRRLMNQRNLLLPRLMSGKLEV